MKSSLKRVLAGLAAVGCLSGAALAAKTVGYLKIEGELAEREVMSSFLFSRPDRMTFRGLIDTLERASRDPGLDGIVLRLVEPKLSLAHIEEVGEALRHLRDAGKKVHIFTEIYGQGEVVLGSFADEVIVQSGGAVSIMGVYTEELFLADMLKWIGITPDYIQIGDYKGAKEMMANSRPSPEWDQNISQLLDSMYARLRGHLKAGRGLTDEQLDRAMADGMFIDPPDAVEFGIADAAVDRMALDDHLSRTYGGDFAWSLRLGQGDPTPDFSRMGLFEAFSQIMRAIEASGGGTARDTIAVVHIDGPIMDGKSSSGGLLGGRNVGSLTIRENLRKIEEDPNVRGVIVRINSPGGSAIASESIWLGLRRIAETTKKPVWTSVGTMAASGGYYIAVAGDRIYVNPSSIVGSIGVVGGKLALGGLYDKLHINVVPRARGPLAGMIGGLSPWNDDERAAITRSMKRIYDQFADRVVRGRKGIDLAVTAEGRLFTGDKAIGLRMADEIGGLDRAINEMAEALGLSAGSFDVMDYPPPMSLQEFFKEGLPFGGSARAEAAVAALREAIGDRAWDQVRDALTAFMLLRREPVILALPRVILFR